MQSEPKSSPRNLNGKLPNVKILSRDSTDNQITFSKIMFLDNCKLSKNFKQSVLRYMCIENITGSVGNFL